MVEEPYSNRTVGMEITAMMMTRREHVGLENNGGGMFWRAMEGMPERETPEGGRDGEHERESDRGEVREEREETRKETNTEEREKEINKKL